MGEFGEKKGAVGCAIGINRIMQIYKGTPESVASTLVVAEDNAYGLAYDLAYNLRVNGCLTEMYIGESNSDAMAYAKETNNTCILRVFSDKKLIIYDLERGETIETNIDTFMGYDDIMAEPEEITPQDMGFRQI